MDTSLTIAGVLNRGPGSHRASQRTVDGKRKLMPRGLPHCGKAACLPLPQSESV